MPSDTTGAFDAQFAQRKRWKLDADLWRAILAVLPDTPQRIVDMGAGIGTYVEALADQGHFAAGVDGIEGIAQLSGGRVLEFDLTEPITWNPPADWCLSVEVGEHIPEHLQHHYLDNVARAATRGLILSWAYPGQRGRGHINCRPESWVREQIELRGWTLDQQATELAKQTAGGGWARKLCIFRRDNEQGG